MRCFTAKSHVLLTPLLLAKVKIYNEISIFVIVWIGDKIPDFA